VNSDSTELLIAILAFGVVALLATAYVHKQKELNVYFVKLFGLLFIGTLAAAIVFADLADETRTGAYTILGTIAGYLAGSKVPTDSDGDGKAPNGNDGGKDKAPGADGADKKAAEGPEQK
jgi:hypothetical protein